MERVKKILLVLGAFVGGMATICMLIKKALEVIAKSDFMMKEIKDSWIDLFIKLLYTTDTNDFINRKLREDGYIRIKWGDIINSGRESMHRNSDYYREEA